LCRALLRPGGLHYRVTSSLYVARGYVTHFESDLYINIFDRHIGHHCNQVASHLSRLSDCAALRNTHPGYIDHPESTFTSRGRPVLLHCNHPSGRHAIWLPIDFTTPAVIVVCEAGTGALCLPHGQMYTHGRFKIDFV